MDNSLQNIKEIFEDINLFLKDLIAFLIKNLHLSFVKFESGKSVFVTSLYKQRGKHSRRLIHSGMAALTALGVVIAPVIADEFPGRSVNPWDITSNSEVLSASTQTGMDTLISDKVRDKVIDYTVVDGDTLSEIANKFGVSTDTIRWQNDITGDYVKVGSTLEILPVTGILHKVQKGDTIYSVAKKYDADPQSIADFPFNTFANDETFELAVGQTLIVPDGVKPSAGATVAAPRARQSTPSAGAITASGIFIWPTQGVITQRFSWYHSGVDIANNAEPSILAADAGVVVYSGCISTGYGCHIMIDHKNGYITLYGHMSRLDVSVGTNVTKGQVLGRMGSTGHSTGPHLHFEVRKAGGFLNPLSFLK